jgi:ParB family chromosome partitioning protein
MDSENIRMLAVGTLRHHPDNPRKNIGDIEELTDSIRKNGVMQNLTVVPAEDELGKFWVLIGNRRLEAAKKAGLDELPCRVAEGLSKIEQIGIMLEENIQRADLTIVEQAQGFQLMLDMGETVAGIAQRTGFSESTIRRRVKLNELDGDALSKAMTSFQLTISDVAELEKVEDVKKRNDLLKKAYSADDLRGKIGAELRAQEKAKGVARIIARLEEMGFKKGKYSQSDIWSSKYEQVGRWSFDTDPETIKDIENSGEMGYFDYWGTIYLLRKNAVEKKKELTPEEKKQKEVAKSRKRINDIKTEIISEMREFMKGKFRDSGILGHNDRISDRENREAWEILCGFGQASIWRNVQLEPLLSDGWQRASDEKKEDAQRRLRAVPIAYQMAWATLKGSSYDIADWNGHYIEVVGRVYDRLYSLLRIWGFRFASDREYELEEVLDGTSELYMTEAES